MQELLEELNNCYKYKSNFCWWRMPKLIAIIRRTIAAEAALQEKTAECERLKETISTYDTTLWTVNEKRNKLQAENDRLKETNSSMARVSVYQGKTMGELALENARLRNIEEKANKVCKKLMVCDTCKYGPKNNGTGRLCTDDCTNFGGYSSIEGVEKSCANCGRYELLNKEDKECFRAIDCLKENKSRWIPFISLKGGS